MSDAIDLSIIGPAFLAAGKECAQEAVGGFGQARGVAGWCRRSVGREK